MKFRMRALIALMTVVVVCDGVVSRGHEGTLGFTLYRWWNFGDVALTLLIGYLFVYPFLILIEQRKTVLAQRRELAVSKHYGLVKEAY